MADQSPAERQLGAVTEAVRSLAEVMRANGLTKIDLDVGEISIRLHAAGVREVVVAAPGAAVERPSPTVAAAPAPVPGHVITAPMIGTFYLTPSPGDPPFAQVGERVEVGQTIGIIEAMKIMNEIPADQAGTVAEILVTNGQPVEYGSALLRIVPDEDAG